MNITRMPEQTLTILRSDKYDELHEGIEKVRSNYPVKHNELGWFATEIEGWIWANAERITANDLSDGRKYGFFELRQNASAREAKTGRWISNHGDLYVTVWTWCASENKFFTKNAWGQISEKKIGAIRAPIIELKD